MLRAQGVFDREAGDTKWVDILQPAVSGPTTTVAAIAELCERLAVRVEKVLGSGGFPVVIGGDHSCAIGTWGGVHRWLGERGPLGLIWIDAHMDSHTFATTPSRALNGMPLACLLGYGEKGLTGVAGAEPKLHPAHVCLLGTRSFEGGEAAFLDKLGVRVIGMEEIRRHGMKKALAEARAIAGNGTAGYGLSMDLDVLDPLEESGVGSPEPAGLRCRELEQALRQLCGDPALLALEIVEYNPHRDRDLRTAKAAGTLFRAVSGA